MSDTRRLRHMVHVMAVCASLLRGSAYGQQQLEAKELPKVEVVGTSLLPGLDVPLREVPANVETIGGGSLQKQRQKSLVDYLEQNATGISLNAAQGNPYQPDLHFRGFTGSPLLGAPQGLSVFQDGVRMNEPFGDAVNWDLLPKSAIAGIQLIPGSNPVYGLNTLGGAVAVHTKRGSTHRGGSVQLTGGSFGNRALEFEQGGRKDNLDYFMAGNLAGDNGWAEHNRSRLRQFFGKVGYQSSTTDMDLSLTTADNRLEGSQTLPLSFSNNFKQAYTYPDLNENQLAFLNARGSHFLSDEVLMGGNLYYRKYQNRNTSSNVNHAFGEVGTGGDIDTTRAVNDRSNIDEDSYGLGLQLTLSGGLAGRKNQLQVGGSADIARTRFTQERQDAAFAADRSAAGLGDFELATDAKTRNHYYGAFFTDTLTLTRQLSLTLAGRYNVALIQIRDQTHAAPELNGDHRFSRFNPAIGVTFNPTPHYTTYASYNEGMRAPTAIELTCANPEAPCKLPNSFLSDPPLRKVVAKTFEVGARGKASERFSWSAALYRTDLDDDIQFISSGGVATNAGFFQNVGRTRRQGLDLATSGKWRSLRMSARYSFIGATYQTPFVENSLVNTSADGAGAILVRSGDRIPGIPRHTFKLRLDYDVNGRWEIGANLLYATNVFARGDENNSDARGAVPGYTVVHLDSRYVIRKGWDVFAGINNLFNREFANFGILGLNAFTGPGNTFDGFRSVGEQFRGFAAPRAIWVGTRYSWM